ncbi:hypothetical protein [Candidatus Stoquefichus massiliensis]|uniref:hypothetical protein n=1 Tax=Candidatus Stoquefichus massiliensis TaxID=1470350 RepID=UPI000488B624|nr:hypothetical protein [Candidatus Stoquefichus massiliensis]
MDELEKELLQKLADSGRVRSLDLLRSDIKNYKHLKNELNCLDVEYAKEVITRQEKVYQSDEEIQKIKSPGKGDGLGGHVESLDQKINRLTEEKDKANEELRKFYQLNNYVYYNRKWVLMSRIANVEKALEEMSEDDRQFIKDIYIEAIGFKKVMKKYRIENNGDVYRKASNILRKIL